MKRYIFILLALALSCAKEAGEPKTAEKTASPEVQESLFIPGKLTVEFDDEIVALIEAGASEETIATKAPGLRSLMDELGIESMERVFPHAGEFEERTRLSGLHRFYSVTYKADVPATKATIDIEDLPGVLDAHPQRKIKKRAFNDPYFSRQWHYVNKSYNNADINVQGVWDNYTTGSSSVIVCVVDEPVDPSHPDLQANLWKDASGHTGYNFVRNSYDLTIRPMNGEGDVGHGTHVAGTIAAVNNNGIGLCGVAGGDGTAGSGVLIQSCAIFSGNDGATDAQTCNAIKWGADHGAVISQNSWGYYADANGDGRVSSSELNTYKSMSLDRETKAAIDYFIQYAGTDKNGNQTGPMKGGLVFFAAGNENINYDVICAYDKVIAVGAFNQTGAKASYSNYGSWVDICAPGGEGTSSSNSIWSTLPQTVADGYGGVENTNYYGGVSWAGTSMACPHASGVAALLVSYYGGPGFTADECKNYLMSGAQTMTQSTSTPIGKRVDALAAFQFAEAGNSLSLDLGSAIPAQIHAHETVTTTVVATSTAGGVSVELQNAPRGVTLSGNILTISGPESSVGYTTFTLMARDAAGNTKSRSVSYTILQNNAPRVVGSVSNTVIAGLLQKTIDVSGLFEDEDGEIPVVKAECSSTAVDLSIGASGLLTIMPRDYGDAVITLTATDFLGLSARVSFKVVTYDPAIPATTYPKWVSDQVNVRINVEDKRSTHVVITNNAGAALIDITQFSSIFTPIALDMKNFAPGYYTIAVSYSGKTTTSRVIKL